MCFMSLSVRLQLSSVATREGHRWCHSEKILYSACPLECCFAGDNGEHQSHLKTASNQHNKTWSACVGQHAAADSWQRSSWWSAGDQMLSWKKNEFDEKEWGWLLGGGCGGGRVVGREIDLSPAAKSHCMCLSDREHYSQSPWINSPAAVHDPVAFFPPNKWSHSPAVRDGRASGTLRIKTIWSGRCLRICFAASRLRGSSSSATLTKTWLNAVISRFPI